MLFRKKIEHSCQYCIYGANIDNDQVLCAKKGLRSITEKCCRFRYDPTKRVPSKPKTLDFSKYNKEDFSL